MVAPAPWFSQAEFRILYRVSTVSPANGGHFPRLQNRRKCCSFIPALTHLVGAFADGCSDGFDHAFFDLIRQNLCSVMFGQNSRHGLGVKTRSWYPVTIRSASPGCA
jgi:hypothetical protein